MTVESCSSTFNHPGFICISSLMFAKRELWLSKIVEIHVSRMGENSELFRFPRFSIKARLFNPKAGSIQGCLFSSRSERSQRRAQTQH